MSTNQISHFISPQTKQISWLWDLIKTGGRLLAITTTTPPPKTKKKKKEMNDNGRCKVGGVG